MCLSIEMIILSYNNAKALKQLEFIFPRTVPTWTKSSLYPFLGIKLHLHTKFYNSWPRGLSVKM